MKPLSIAAAVLPVLAFAAGTQLDVRQDPALAAQRQHAQSRMRIMRLVGLADALGLDEAQALRLHETMRPYDERRAALEAENAGLARLVKRAADGDSAAFGQVDQALQRMFDNRAEIQRLNREMIEAAGRLLSPRQRAQMAVFFATFGGELREMQKRAQDRARQEALKAAAERMQESSPR